MEQPKPIKLSTGEWFYQGTPIAEVEALKILGQPAPQIVKAVTPVVHPAPVRVEDSLARALAEQQAKQERFGNGLGTALFGE